MRYGEHQEISRNPTYETAGSKKYGGGTKRDETAGAHSLGAAGIAAILSCPSAHDRASGRCAVKSIMESEPEDPVAGLAVHFGVVATEPQPTGGGASSSESDLATRLGEEHASAFEAAVKDSTRRTFATIAHHFLRLGGGEGMPSEVARSSASTSSSRSMAHCARRLAMALGWRRLSRSRPS